MRGAGEKNAITFLSFHIIWRCGNVSASFVLPPHRDTTLILPRSRFRSRSRHCDGAGFVWLAFDQFSSQLKILLIITRPFQRGVVLLAWIQPSGPLKTDQKRDMWNSSYSLRPYKSGNKRANGSFEWEITTRTGCAASNSRTLLQWWCLPREIYRSLIRNPSSHNVLNT